MATIGTDVLKAKAILERGDLVAIPTETVYGLAGNALDVSSVTKIFQVKNRPSFDPLIIHTNSLERAASFLKHVPDMAYTLAEALWPGPLTLLLEKQSNLPDLVTSGLDRVAIRIPNHPMTLQLLTQLDFPLAAPSANPFGYISPTEAIHVNDQLGAKLEYILDGGPCSVGVESTIVGFEDGKPWVYRTGGTSIEQIEALIGSVSVQSHSTSNPAAPGMLKSHYAPTKPLIIGDLQTLTQQYEGKNFGILSFDRSFGAVAADKQITLSPMGSTQEAAQKLFGALRVLDKLPIEFILAEYVPEKGLGKAINDRLKRASIQL